MATTFKQKTCPKCKRNHDESGVLCSFCMEDAENKMRQQRLAPQSYWVECLIPREGDTQFNIGNLRYIFKKNNAGASVCNVINAAHYQQLIKSSFYRPYIDCREPVPIDAEIPARSPPEPIPKTKLFCAEADIFIDRLLAKGATAREIASLMSEESDEPVPWQRVQQYIKIITVRGYDESNGHGYGHNDANIVNGCSTC